MKALLDCTTAGRPAAAPLGFDPFMATVVDRPFVQRVLEWIAEAGIRNLTLLTDGPMPALTSLVESGDRWGMDIRWRRLLPDGGFNLTSAAEDAGLLSGVLLARGDSLPLADIAAGRPLPTEETPPAYFREKPDGTREWTGWAWLTGASLKGTSRLTSAGDWHRRMTTWAFSRECAVVASSVLQSSTVADLLDAQRFVLEARESRLRIDAREVKPGVWLAKGAQVAAETRLRAPVYVGSYAWIRGDEAGPAAVIGDRAVVSKGAAVSDACIGAGTMVGAHVEIRGAIARGTQLFHRRLNGPLDVTEPLWLQQIGLHGGDC